MSDALNRHSNYGSVSRFLQPLLFAALLPISAASAQQNLKPGEVHGVVVDGATGAPLSRVLVADEEAAELRKAVTAADGTFTLRLPAGLRRLRASVVGYGMARQAVDV